MPGPYPAKNGIMLTVGFLTGKHRWQCAIPFVSETTTDNPLGRSSDILDRWDGTLLPDWLALLAEDTQAVGIQIEALADDTVIPQRFVYGDGVHVGAIGGESCPPGSSMLVSFYGTGQMALLTRTIVAKNFIGPCPEAEQGGGVISNAQQGRMQTLGGHISQMFAGGDTGVNWHRSLVASRDAEAQVYEATDCLARFETFTQKRRNLPLF